MEWYYALNGHQTGPVSESELRQLLHDGVVTPATLVWRAGMADWQPYSAAVSMPAAAPSSATFPPAARGGFVYAGFWIRVLAYIIDGALIGMIRGIVLMPFGFNMMGYRHGMSPWIFAYAGQANLMSLALGIAYFAFFWTQYGATPGKMVLGLKVVTPEGGLISLGQAVGRYFGQILGWITLGIGFIMAGVDDEKRALHDRLAGTRVIRTSQTTPPRYFQ